MFHCELHLLLSKVLYVLFFGATQIQSIAIGSTKGTFTTYLQDCQTTDSLQALKLVILLFKKVQI